MARMWYVLLIARFAFTGYTDGLQSPLVSLQRALPRNLASALLTSWIVIPLFVLFYHVALPPVLSLLTALHFTPFIQYASLIITFYCYSNFH
jgi:hypothetical protein